MKKLFIIISLLLASFICVAQKQQIQSKANHTYNYQFKQLYYVPSPDTIPLINITVNQLDGQNGWALNGQSCYGCASFFYKILRSRDPYKAEDDVFYYFYYFYFFSNSYSIKGKIATTSLKDINFESDDMFVFNVPYILIEPNNITYGAWIRSINPQNKVTFHANNITVY